jgi:hypothetical protein
MVLVRTDVWEELSASFIRVTRISKLGTTLAATSNRRSQCVENLKSFMEKYRWTDYLCYDKLLRGIQNNILKQRNSVAFNPQANYADRMPAACR